MTNTDESAFADAHPRDGEKFTQFIHMARPAWTTEVYPVKDGVFPQENAQFDGVMITGSPASVRSDADWIAPLLDLIRRYHAQGQPMFGACFGHQALAQALGGALDKNPGGWVHGVVAVDCIHPLAYAELPDVFYLSASHAEQVSAAPAGAKVYASSPGCPVAGFVIADHVLTTQHHPEIGPSFLAALTEEMAEGLGDDLTATARASLSRAPDQAMFAEIVARFFEAAHRR
ncbi:MAG: type 1 glutamine amidotransferase [Pseudomonadota bacterium]